MEVIQEEASAFDTVIEAIGNAGPYQKRFNYLFNLLLVIAAAMPHLNIILALSVPEHWCAIPGRENTNLTLDEWRDLHIPKEYDAKGKLSFSRCKMFNNSNTEDIIDCQNGWEFDNTWYQITAPTQNEWVCDKELNVANSIASARSGEVIGTFIFGHLADTIGRRPVFFATVVTILVGRTLWTVTSSYIYLFFLTGFIGNLPSTSVFQGPLVIAMEISRPEDRAYISMLQCYGWTIGMMIMPLLMWYLGSWISFILWTTLPLGLFLFSGPYMIESPRWLASQGKIKKCLKELKKVADVNGTSLPSSAESTLLKAVATHQTHHNGVLGLFSSFRLAKNTICLVVGWAILLLVYTVITLGVNNLGGNPYFNYLGQNFAELPAYLLGKYVSDKFGRRFTSVASFFFCTLGCIPVLFVVHDEQYTWAVSAACIFLKFSISLAFFSINLQSLEIYPTCVRQTGISLGVIVGAMLGITAPYIVLAGTTISARFPYILMAGLCFLAGFCSIFLPETFGHRLPETLEEAAQFGADQNFLGRPKKRHNSLPTYDEAEKPLKSAS